MRQRITPIFLKSEIKKETAGRATVEYPVVSNMKDAEKQNQVNALLRTNAMLSPMSIRIRLYR